MFADVDIYIATECIDLRASFDLLCGLAKDRMGQDSKSGALFVFIGKRKDKLKALFYDKTGYCILYKRLCRGTFAVPQALVAGAFHVELSEEELQGLLHGLGGGVGERRRRSRQTKKVTITVH